MRRRPRGDGTRGPRTSSAARSSSTGLAAPAASASLAAAIGDGIACACASAAMPYFLVVLGLAFSASPPPPSLPSPPPPPPLLPPPSSPPPPPSSPPLPDDVRGPPAVVWYRTARGHNSSPLITTTSWASAVLQRLAATDNLPTEISTSATCMTRQDARQHHCRWSPTLIPLTSDSLAGCGTVLQTLPSPSPPPSPPQSPPPSPPQPPPPSPPLARHSRRGAAARRASSCGTARALSFPVPLTRHVSAALVRLWLQAQRSEGGVAARKPQNRKWPFAAFAGCAACPVVKLAWRDD
jgi:hypothetical protein